MIKILTDILPAGAADEVEAMLLNPNFPWFHYANTNYADSKTRANDVPQFTHGFIRDDQNNSPYENIPRAILSHMGIADTHIIRAKANLLMREPSPFTHPAHTDDKKDHVAFIYYVNDSDGETHFYEKGRVSQTIRPKKGTGVMFDGHILHASSSPTQNRFRIVINYNLTRGPYFEMR